MHRSRAPSIAPGTFVVAQSWADCITNMPGFNLRQAHLQIRTASLESQMIPMIQHVFGQTLRLFHRLVPNSAISIEYFWNMAIRLLVNSAMTLRISTGDLIVASLWANSKANCMLACAISSSFA
jgi:hypothetical protein